MEACASQVAFLTNISSEKSEKTKFIREGNEEKNFIRFSWPTLWHWIPKRIFGQQERRFSVE